MRVLLKEQHLQNRGRLVKKDSLLLETVDISVLGVADPVALGVLDDLYVMTENHCHQKSCLRRRCRTPGDGALSKL